MVTAGAVGLLDQEVREAGEPAVAHRALGHDVHPGAQSGDRRLDGGGQRLSATLGTFEHEDSQ